jgi:hypothetical protein
VKGAQSRLLVGGIRGEEARVDAARAHRGDLGVGHQAPSHGSAQRLLQLLGQLRAAHAGQLGRVVGIHERAGFEPAALADCQRLEIDLDDRARRYALHVHDRRRPPIAPPAAQRVAQHVRLRLPRNAAREQRADLAREVHAPVHASEIERLDAEAVPHQQDPATCAIERREGEQSIALRNSVLAPCGEDSQQRLGIASAAVAWSGQPLAQLSVVEDLAVEVQ